MTSWADALTQHSPDELLAMLRQQKHEAEEKARALNDMIITVEQIASSESLWQHITVAVPGPRPPSTGASPPSTEDGQHADQTALHPPEPPTHAGQKARDLADRADDPLTRFDDDEDNAAFPQPTLVPSSAPGHQTQGTQRERVLAVARKTPKRWWSAMDLCEAIGVPSHRRLRIALNNMVARGELVKRKEPGRKSVYYQLAPTSAQEAAVSG